MNHCADCGSPIHLAILEDGPIWYHDYPLDTLMCQAAEVVPETAEV